MKIVKKYIVLIFVLFWGVSHAQTDKLLVELGIEMFDFGDYEDALEVFEQALEHNENNVKAYFYLGKCYLQTTDRKGLAIESLKKAYDLDPEISNKIFFLIGEAYRYQYQFDEAINFYILFKDELETNRRLFLGENVAGLLKKTDRKIEECENAKKFVNNPKPINLTQLGSSINTEYEEYAPTLSVDGNTLIFTSRRSGSTGSLKDVDNKYYEDIWMSKKVNGEWTTAINMGEAINTDFHESNTVISPDNTQLFIYRSDNNGDIYYAEKKGDDWDKPKPFKMINTEAYEASAFISSDGQHLFYTSGKEGGNGGLDIYHSKLGPKGKWLTAENLGDKINTEYDEDGPSYDVNTNTLYFSSKGHNSMGGFDVYYIEYDDETEEWRDPVNLGYPVNSPEDDLHFVISADGEVAYYATTRKDSHGEHDIYLVDPAHIIKGDSVYTVLDTTQAREIDTTEVVIENPVGDQSYFLEVMVQNEAAELLPTKIKVTDLSNNTTLNQQEIEGLYQTEFRNTEAKNYVLTIESDGYLYQTMKLEIPAMADEEFTLKKIVVLKAPKVKKVNILRNVYFAFDKHTISHKSIQELNLLLKFMNDSPSAVIELAGHTCFIGSPSYNDRLSQQRALAVRNYLIKKGVDGSRIIAKGYGESRPLASNDDEEEGREINRRTEFIILSK